MGKHVGQAERRIKDRIYEHLRDLDQANKEKPLGLYFFFMKEVHILEFILKKPQEVNRL